MSVMYYVRRAKSKTGEARHNTLHVANNDKTFCGKEMDEMWFIEPSHNLTPDDVNCRGCKAVLSSRTGASMCPPRPSHPCSMDTQLNECVPATAARDRVRVLEDAIRAYQAEVDAPVQDHIMIRIRRKELFLLVNPTEVK